MFIQLKYSYNYEEEKFFPKEANVKNWYPLFAHPSNVFHISTLTCLLDPYAFITLCMSSMNVSTAVQ
jgi:hypothetical protein